MLVVHRDDLIVAVTQRVMRPAKKDSLLIVVEDLRLEFHFIWLAFVAARIDRLRVILQIRPNHWHSVVWIIASPHSGLVSIIDHGRADVGHLEENDKTLNVAFALVRL